MKITTRYSAEQLTEIGRAMERVGIEDVGEFIIWATSKQAAETLKKEEKP